MPHSLASMTKESLIKAVESYGCGKLKTLPLAYMTKEQIVQHLKDCECPMIQKLLRGQV
jgi:hypothetical protein